MGKCPDQNKCNCLYMVEFFSPARPSFQKREKRIRIGYATLHTDIRVLKTDAFEIVAWILLIISTDRQRQGRRYYAGDAGGGKLEYSNLAESGNIAPGHSAAPPCCQRPGPGELGHRAPGPRNPIGAASKDP